MLDNCQNAKERWGGVHQLIDRWLKERQELLVHYCDLSDTARGTASEDLGKKLERLCQILVDYTSAGHFEIHVESEAFEGKNRVAQHQLVYGAITRLMTGDAPPVHAIDRLDCSLP